MLSQSASFWNRPLARKVVLWGGLLLLAHWPVWADPSVTLSWNPSLDPNVAGYKIYYGPASRVYTNSITLGNVTNVTVSGLNAGATYYFGATTLSASGIESTFSNEATDTIPAPPAAVYLPPAMDALTNLTVYQNAGLQTVVLTNINSGMMDGNLSLRVSAGVSDTTLIPLPTVNYTNGNNYGTLTFAPAADALGTATVTVMLNNGAASNNLTSQTFTVSVVPIPVVYLPPAMDALTNLTIYQNAGLQTVVLTNISAGTLGQNVMLNLSANSSDSSVIPMPTVDYTNGNNFALLTFAPATNALGTVTVTVTLDNGAASNNLTSQAFTVRVITDPNVNQAPTLDPIANVTIVQYGGIPAIALTGITSGSATERQTLKIAASSSNPNFLPAPKISYASPGRTGTLTFRSPLNATGMATITVTVNDGGRSNNIVRQSFTVTVSPNHPPTLDAIADMTVNQNAGTQSITLTGITSGSLLEHQTLRVSASSSNPRLVSAPTIQYASPANTAVLTFMPVGTNSGWAIITITVNDGARNNNYVRRSFKVTVSAASVTVSNLSRSSSGAGTLTATGVAVNGNTAATLTAVASTPGRFSFQLTGVSGGKYVVQAGSDLIHWTSVETNTAPFLFQDTATNAYRQRFYRAYYLP